MKLKCKQRFLSLLLALTMTATACIGSVPVFAGEADSALEAFDVNDETYNFRDTMDLEASIETSSTGDDVVTLTWPAVDKEGTPIKVNPLRSTSAYGNPVGSWTSVTQGMIIAFNGWDADNNTTKISSSAITGDETLLVGLTSTPTSRKMAILDAKTNEFLDTAYLSDEATSASGFATAYIIEYSKDGENFTADKTVSGISHGKKIVHVAEDGSYKTDSATTYFLKDQLVEEMNASLEPETEYTIRVKAVNAKSTSTVYKTFETKITTGAAKVKTPAFATVEGGGTYSQGGRGGDVYVVTNLTDSVTDPQPGSLRYGLLRKDRTDGNTTAPRTIVFAVGGTINIDPEATKSTRRMSITSNTTVLGQTAPGDGITIAGASLKIEGENIILRYIHCRLGGGYDADAATATGRYIVVDHCSFSWGVDEVFSAKEVLDSSFQYNIISSGLAMPNKNGEKNSDVEIVSGESEAKHGMGSILNGSDVSYTHNLWAHNGTRNPRFEGSFSYNNVTYQNKIDYANNVVYDWGHNSTYGGERGNGQMNFVGNYYKPGPETLEKVKTRFFECDSSGTKKGTYYINGNVMASSDEVTADNTAGFEKNYDVLSSPLELTVPYEATSAEDAYKAVLASVGASKHRDAQDNRLIYEVENGLGAFINDEAEAGGFDSTVVESTEADTDNDGLPDSYELANGLDPNNASDSTLIIEDEASPYYGYSNIEVYAGNLVGDWDESYVPANEAKNVQITAILDKDGTDVMKSAGRTTLISGESYTVKLSDDTITSDVLLNDELVGSDKGVVSITPSTTGVYNMACMTENNGYKNISIAVPVTVVVGTENIEGYTSADFGEVGATGADNYDEATGTLYAQGTGRIGITNSEGRLDPDAYHYNYKEVSGNFEFTAKVDSIAKVGYCQYAGLMLRGSLESDSEFYMTAVTYIKGEDYEGSKDVAGQDVKAKLIGPVARTANGGSVSYAYPSIGLGVASVRQGETPTPAYARITRVDDTVTLSGSIDGETWYTLKEYTTTLPETCYLGFAMVGGQNLTENVYYNVAAFSEISLDSVNVLGDADCDGKLSANDAALVLQYVLDRDFDGITAQGVENAKVTDEDVISANQSAHILQKVLDESYVFPILESK